MVKKKYLLFLISFSYCYFLFGQKSQLDSINAIIKTSPKEKVIDLYISAAEIALEHQVDSVSYYLNEIKSLPKVKADSTLLIKILKLKGGAKRKEGNYVEALQLFEPCYKYFKKHKDSLQLAYVANQLGSMNVFMGYHKKAQKYLFEVYDIYQNLNNQKKLASATNGLAIFYSNIGQENTAIEKYKEALALYKITKDTIGQANVHANLGLTFTDLDRYKEAEYHLKQQAHLDSLSKSQWGLGFYFDFMGYLKRKQGNLNDALWHNKKALEIRQQLPSHYNIAESRVSLADVYFDLKQYNNAIYQAKQILINAENRQSLHQQQAAYKVLANSYEAKKDFKISLNYFKNFQQISDSIYNQEQQEAIEDNNAKFQFQQQQNKISILNLENSSKEKLLSQKNNTILIITITLFLFTLLSGLLFMSIRKYLKQKKSLSKALNEKEILFKEVHHRVKNNLQLISSLLTLQGASIDDESVQRAIKEGKTRVRSMALIHQDLYQNDTLRNVNAKTYLEKLTTELFDTYNITPEKVELKLELDNLEIDIDTLVPLGLIINELISNSLKYAFPDNKKGVISVSLKNTVTHFNLVIKDDGIGFNMDKIAPTSFGKRLVTSLTEQIDGVISIKTTRGTSVHLTIPKNIN